MLAAIGGAFAMVAILARTTPVFANHVRDELVRLETSNGLYYFDNAYVDEGDYVLLGKVLRDDFSEGGVYIIGSSEFNTALMDWRLTEAERRRIRNYSLGDVKHTEVRHYLRMLVEDVGLLEAGGERTTVILGLSFQLARRKRDEMYVENLFRRHGLFTYDWEAGIRLTPMSPLQRDLIAERDRANRYLRLAFFPRSRVRVTPDAHEIMIDHMRRVMAGDWRGAMQQEVQQLADQIDYLQARGVRVLAVYPPTGSWQDTLPYEAAYREMVNPILAARNVQVTDLGQLLPDADYMDALHARYRGQEHFHAALRALALDALAVMETRNASQRR
jgi:hypothetical protein